MKVEAAVDAGNDVLIVRGIDDRGSVVHAFGWMSSLMHHPDRMHPEGESYVEPDYREMTTDEKDEFFVRLLQEQNSDSRSPALTNLL